MRLTHIRPLQGGVHQHLTDIGRRTLGRVHGEVYIDQIFGHYRKPDMAHCRAGPVWVSHQLRVNTRDAAVHDHAVHVTADRIRPMQYLRAHIGRATPRRGNSICFHWRAVVVDLPGMGHSRLHGMPYTWSSQRACLVAYLQSQPPFVLVVHDIAGPVALPLLSQLPQLRGVIVHNTPFDTGNLHPPFPLNWIRNAGRLGKPLAYTMNFPFYQMRVRQMGIARDDQVPKAFLRNVYEEITADGGKGRVAEVAQGFELGAATDQAIRNGFAVNVPQLFIWGEADPALGKEIDKLPPRRSNRRLERLSEAKHFLTLDFDEEITNLIEAWLRAEIDSPKLNHTRFRTRKNQDIP